MREYYFINLKNCSLISISSKIFYQDLSNNYDIPIISLTYFHASVFKNPKEYCARQNFISVFINFYCTIVHCTGNSQYCISDTLHMIHKCDYNK